MRHIREESTLTLRQLLDGLEIDDNTKDCAKVTISSDTRTMQAGSVFFAIPGLKFDGHDFAAQALEKGAAAVVAERDLGLRDQILVPDSRRAYAVACGNYFGNPARKLKLMGVTGTNGKTTVTCLIKHILRQAGKKAGLVGTIHNEIGDTVIPTRNTTPDPIQLHAMFAEMVREGCEYAVMEVSSHALDQQRVEGLRFLTAAFTNLTQDHLDYHDGMEGYYRCKRRLFALCDTAVVNLDDEYGRRILREAGCRVRTYSCGNDEADCVAHDIRYTRQGSRFAMLAEGKLTRVSCGAPGMFAVSNAMAAALSCLAAGIGLDTVVQALASSPGVPGRMEILPTDTPYTVIRDYAHSPDGVEKVLKTAKEFSKGRVVALFGCGGNRDRTKRPVMAETASRLADFCILTSDNPRDEAPERIVEDCLPGLREHDTPYEVIVDRYEAILWALDHAQPDDTLLLLGKGHEDYQVLSYGTIHFDEKEIVMSYLSKKS